MTQLVSLLRSLVRDELRRQRGMQLGQVTQVFPHEGGTTPHLALNVRLRGSELELQKVPLMTQRRGESRLPLVGDLVLVGYIDQDAQAPVVLGFFYDESAPPPEAGADEWVYTVPDDESSNARRFEMRLPNGNRLTLKDGELEIELGSTIVRVETDGNISLEAGGDISLEASGSISIRAGGEMSLEAQQALKAKGLELSLEGQATGKLKAPAITLAGNTSFSPS